MATAERWAILPLVDLELSVVLDRQLKEELESSPDNCFEQQSVQNFCHVDVILICNVLERIESLMIMLKWIINIKD